MDGVICVLARMSPSLVRLAVLSRLNQFIFSITAFIFIACQFGPTSFSTEMTRILLVQVGQKDVVLGGLPWRSLQLLDVPDDHTGGRNFKFRTKIL